MTSRTEDDPLHFPVSRTCPFDPPAEYAKLRAEAPISEVVLPTGARAWLVTRHADVRHILADPRFSADRRNPGFPAQDAAVGAIASGRRPPLLSMDDPEHAQARRSVVGEFTVAKVQKLEPRIQQITDSHIDAMLDGDRPADLVRALCLPVPSQVACELLGVPYADHEFFQTRSAVMAGRLGSREEIMNAHREMRAFLDGLVAAKENDPPGDDLLSRLIAKQRAAGTVDHDGLVGMAGLLLAAGHETTANMISLGVLGLLQNPDQRAAIRNDPAKTPQAVEELLRYFTIGGSGPGRVALEDVEIGGVLIRAGDGVIALAQAANRDPDAFDDPNTLDVTRGARHHVAFGFGTHQCLGQNLARAELRIVFDTLFRRVPTLRLAAEFEALHFKDPANIFGLYHLPVTW